MARVALDTNVLAYAEGAGDTRRCKAARELVARLPGHLVVVPAQALGELHRVLVGKSRRPPADARAAILSWADAFEVADSTFDAMRAASRSRTSDGIFCGIVLALASTMARRSG